MKHTTIPAVVEELLAGRERIKNGWCQGRLELYLPECLGGMQYCAMGALGELGDMHLAEKAFRHLQDSLPFGFHTVSVYNDDPRTTHADIIALFDRAIALALAES